MILQDNKKATVLTNHIEESTNMSIDASDMGVLMMILSEGLYSDPIGSSVREYVSNAIDAHIEAGITEPVIVSLKQNSDATYCFSVQDFGTGMSPERVTTVISKYAASTKRESTETYGFFGLGLKSGLAYTDCFFINTVYEGTFYKYAMRKGEETTVIDLLHSEPSLDRNGSTIVIPLKSWYDRTDFIEKIKEQLCYFEGVYFDVSGIENDFKIIKHKDWKFSYLFPGNEMHLCLNDVYYAIDWKKLGLPTIYLPIGLVFDLKDGLITPIPNRENIRYSLDTKNAILAKIKEVANYFVEKYNETISAKQDVRDIWAYLAGDQQKIVEIEGYDFELDKTLQEQSTISLKEPTLEGIEKLDLTVIYKNRNNIFDNYTITANINNNKFSNKDKGYRIDNYWLGKNNVIIVTTPPTKVKIDYIKDTLGNCIFIKKRHNGRKLKSYDDACYFKFLKLYNQEKGDWRQIITEYQKLEESIINGFIIAETIEPHEQWLFDRKNNKAKGVMTKVAKVEINPKFARDLEKYSSLQLCKFVQVDYPISLNSLVNDSYLTVYGTIEQRGRLEELYDLGIRQKTNLKVAILVNRDIERVQQSGLTNWLSMEEFMEGTHEIFGQFCTAKIIEKLINSNVILFQNRHFLEKIDSEVGNSMIEIETYSEKIKRNTESELLTSMLAVCEEHEYWDQSMYPTYILVRDRIEEFKFCESLRMRGNQIEPFCLDLAKEYYQMKKELVTV